MLIRLRSIADGVWRFLRETHIVRLAIMAVKLWRSLRLLSIALAVLVLGCTSLAGLSARLVFVTLAPASPSGIGAGIAAGLVGLVLLELCAVVALAGIEAVLQLAHDTGRHRSGALLTLATILAAAGAAGSLADGAALSVTAWFSTGIAAMLIAITGWFQRAYRRPAWRGFRDFHADVVEARHFLARAAHDV
ncbi:hypothetical protein ASE63_00395 [Bosea sp. Root381]|uniref:hypothetical protein n=1 Tax=Bosea sp. Root381 TaxID=1736524 RepID=UPI0007124901|nr:hypothetical protein [Bosea sp. Root381]KRE17703.1 hypothetical protein ASE63_00395 [Bosea sp. Root381]